MPTTLLKRRLTPAAASIIIGDLDKIMAAWVKIFGIAGGKLNLVIKAERGLKGIRQLPAPAFSQVCRQIGNGFVDNQEMELV